MSPTRPAPIAAPRPALAMITMIPTTVIATTIITTTPATITTTPATIMATPATITTCAPRRSVGSPPPS